MFGIVKTKTKVDLGEDLYSMLGVDKKAPVSEIKRAYYKLSKEFHPDVGGDPEVFQKLSQAYNILSDEGKRAQYDAGANPDDLSRDRLDELANTALATLFEDVIRKGDPKYTHYKRDMIEGLDARRKGLKQDLKSLKLQKERHEIILSRLRGTSDMFRNILEDKIKGCDLKKFDIEHAIRVLDHAEKKIENFGYEADKEPETKINSVRSFDSFSPRFGTLDPEEVQRAFERAWRQL